VSNAPIYAVAHALTQYPGGTLKEASMTLADIRSAMEREYDQVRGEVHEEVQRFVSWLEQRQNAIDAAVKLLQDNGYTVSKAQ
jgi:hypothetical protein